MFTMPAFKFCFTPLFSNSSTTVEHEQSTILANNKPVEDPTFIDPKEPGAYEKIRQRNIKEREKLFLELKISQLKKAGISNISK